MRYLPFIQIGIFNIKNWLFDVSLVVLLNCVYLDLKLSSETECFLCLCWNSFTLPCISADHISMAFFNNSFQILSSYCKMKPGVSVSVILQVWVCLLSDLRFPVLSEGVALRALPWAAVRPRYPHPVGGQSLC